MVVVIGNQEFQGILIWWISEVIKSVVDFVLSRIVNFGWIFFQFLFWVLKFGCLVFWVANIVFIFKGGRLGLWIFHL